MSGWSDSLQAQAAKAFNKYNDPSMSYELNNAAEHVEFLEQRIAELEGLLTECCEDYIEGPHVLGLDLWERLKKYHPPGRSTE